MKILSIPFLSLTPTFWFPSILPMPKIISTPLLLRVFVKFSLTFKTKLFAWSAIFDLSNLTGEAWIPNLAKFGIHASPVRFERSKIADHANNLVLNVRENLTKTLKRSGVEIILGIGRIEGNQKVGVRDKNGIDKIFTCKNIVIATGSSPFVQKEKSLLL